MCYGKIAKCSNTPFLTITLKWIFQMRLKRETKHFYLLLLEDYLIRWHTESMKIIQGHCIHLGIFLETHIMCSHENVHMFLPYIYERGTNAK